MFESPPWTKSKLTDPSNWHWVRCIHVCQMVPPSCMAAAIWVAECEYFERGNQVWHQYTKNSMNARAKFELMKTMFNAESFIRRLSRSISSDFSAIRSWNVYSSQKSQKIHEILYFGIQGHPRSLLLVAIKSQCMTSY